MAIDGSGTSETEGLVSVSGEHEVNSDTGAPGARLVQVNAASESPPGDARTIRRTENTPDDGLRSSAELAR